MGDLESDIIKYKKKKPSSKSKSKEKSNHKHKYKNCLLIEEDSKLPYCCKAKYCTICGKISDIKMFDIDERGRMLHYDEVFAKYKNLEKFYISDIFHQKYVYIDRGGE